MTTETETYQPLPVCRSVNRSYLPVGFFKGIWSGFTVVPVDGRPSFEVTNHQASTVECLIIVKTNNVAYIHLK